MPASCHKLAEWFYGGHQPRDVALAVALGILTGALSGGNASWAVVLLAAIALNVHTRFFLCAWPASALMAWLAHGHLEAVGRFSLDGTPLGHALGQLGDGLLIPLLGWDQYTVVGGALLGAIAALVGGYIFYRVTARLNRRWCATPPRPPAGEAAEAVDPPHPVSPVLTCLWYGPSHREQTVLRQAAPRRLRRGGVPSTLAASMALAAACWWLANQQAERELWRQLSDCNGGKVAAESTDISLWTGHFAIRGLHFAKPGAAGHERLYVGAAKGTFSPGLLLRGYLSVDKLVLEDVRTAAVRGTLRRQMNDSAGEFLGQPAAATQENDLVLNHHLRHWDLFCRQLGALEQVVSVIARLPDVEQCGLRATPARSELGVARPRVAVRQARIAELANGWNLGRKALLEAKNLSSRPPLAGHRTELKLIVPKFGAEIEIAFAAGAMGKHAVRCSACNVELPQIVDSPYVSRTVCFHAGRAKLNGKGECDAERLNLQFEADIESLAADVSSHERLAGIEPETWQAGLARLGCFHTQLVLGGPWSAPVMTVDRRQLVADFQRQLQLAGAEDLLIAVNTQLAFQETRREGPFVVQASALDAQVSADAPGFCDFAEDALPPPAMEPASEALAGSERLPAEAIEQEAVPYPATEFEPAVPASEATAMPEVVSPPPVRRPLPGPVNMAIGHDPQSAVFSTGSAARTAASGPREKVLARWSRAWREKFTRPAAGTSTEDEPPIASAAAEPLPPREPVSAAASEVWYNRRWR